jgi:hypothetical protein
VYRLNSRAGRLVASLAIGVTLSVGPFACSSSGALSAAGGPCTVVTDCQDGLICCNGSPGNKASLTCAMSTSCLQPSGMGGDAGNAASGDDAAPGEDGGQIPATDGTTPIEPPETGSVAEAEAPETSSTPPMEAGKPQDDGGREAATPVDSGGGAPDAASE